MKKLAVEFKLKAEKKDFTIINIKDSRNVFDYAIDNLYSDDIIIFESVYILLLNQRGNVIGYARISQGALNSCLVDVRLIAKYAIESLCTSVILIHNHPSGNLIPSIQDKNITSKLKKTLEILDIKLLDHIIVSEKEYYSFSDNCIL